MKTDNTKKKKKWWKDFIFGIKREWNENLCKGGESANAFLLKNDWALDETALIGNDGRLYLSGFDPKKDDSIWDYDFMEYLLNAYHEQNTPLVSSIITNDDYETLCSDLGTTLGNYDSISIGVFLKGIHKILQNRSQMPEVRRRRKLLFFVDNTSKADGRRLKNYVDLTGKPKWGDFGNDDEKRKESLVSVAINKEKGKKLCKLLKCKRSYKEIIADVQRRAAKLPLVTPQPQTQTPVATQPQQTQTAVTPTTPQTPVEKYNQALSNQYACARKYWNNGQQRVITLAINKFIAKLFWNEKDYQYVFNDDIARNNLINRGNTSGRNINN